MLCKQVRIIPLLENCYPTNKMLKDVLLSFSKIGFAPSIEYLSWWVSTMICLELSWYACQCGMDPSLDYRFVQNLLEYLAWFWSFTSSESGPMFASCGGANFVLFIGSAHLALLKKPFFLLFSLFLLLFMGLIALFCTIHKPPCTISATF